jgi:hypothetical protein
VKLPRRLDKDLTAALAARCTGTGNVYRWGKDMELDTVIAEFADGDVEISTNTEDHGFRHGWKELVVRQLLVAHGEIRVPGQL